LGVRPDVFTQLTTGTDNVAIGSGASSSDYSLTTGSGNVMLGANSGGGGVTESNNTLLGYNTSMLASYILGSIALGAGTKITGYNQLMVASNVTQFNIARLLQQKPAWVSFWSCNVHFKTIKSLLKSNGG